MYKASFIVIFLLFIAANLYPQDNKLKTEMVETKSPEKAKIPPSEEPDIILVTSNRKKDTETSVPSSYISEKETKRKVAKSLEGLFESEAGIDTVSAGYGSMRPMIRGLFDERVLVLYDGIRFSEYQGGGNHVLGIDEFQVESVEIIRGPASMLWGSDAIGGVINFKPYKAHQINKQGLRFGILSKTLFQTAAFGWKESLSFDFGKDGFNFFVQGIYNNFDDIETPHKTLNPSYNHGYTINASGNYLWDDSILELSFYTYNKDVAIPHKIAEYNYFDNEKQHFGILSYSKKKISDAIQNLIIKSSFQQHNIHYKVKHIVMDDHSHHSNGHDETEYHLMEIFKDYTTYIFQPQVDFIINDSNTLTTGMLLYSENISSKRNEGHITEHQSDSDIGEALAPVPDASKVNAGIFVQDKISINDDFSITPAVRYDYNKTESKSLDNHPSSNRSHEHSILSGNLGLLYHLNKPLYLYTNVGRAFRTPTLVENFWFGAHHGVIQQGNPKLKPESSVNIDVGTKIRVNRSLKANVSLFYNRLYDFIKEQPIGVNQSGQTINTWENVGNAAIYGSEVELSYSLKMLTVFGNIAYLEGEDLDNNSYLPYMPPLKGKYGIRYTYPISFENRFLIWGEIFGISAAKQNKLAPSERLGGRRETPGWSRIDVKLGTELQNKYSLVLSFENIFDKAYSKHLSNITWMDEQPGFNFSLALSLAL